MRDKRTGMHTAHLIAQLTTPDRRTHLVHEFAAQSSSTFAERRKTHEQALPGAKAALQAWQRAGSIRRWRRSRSCQSQQETDLFLLLRRYE